MLLTYGKFISAVDGVLQGNFGDFMGAWQVLGGSRHVLS